VAEPLKSCTPLLVMLRDLERTPVLFQDGVVLRKKVQDDLRTMASKLGPSVSTIEDRWKCQLQDVFEDSLDSARERTLASINAGAWMGLLEQGKPPSSSITWSITPEGSRSSICVQQRCWYRSESMNKHSLRPREGFPQRLCTVRIGARSPVLWHQIDSEQRVLLRARLRGHCVL
jgi:hypothetical protein